MAKEGFTDSDFYLELELYDVVRPPTWQSWSLASSNFASSSSAPAPKPTTISSPIVNTSALDPNADFWKNIKTLSATTYDNEETSVLVDTLEELLDDRMANFSLDDLELLAASMLRPSH